MGVAAGISFEAAISHGLVGLSSRPRDRTRLTFALMALAAGVGAIAVMAMYSVDSPSTHVAVTKWLFVPSHVVFTVAAAWLVALFSGVRPKIWLWALTGGGVIVLAVNAALPYGLLHETLGDLREVWVFGAHIMDMSASDLHPLHVLDDAITLAAFVFMYYALARLLRRGERAKATYLALATALFSVTTLLDTLADHGVVATLYLTQLCFVGLVLTMSIALRRESLRWEQELRAYRTRLESLVEERVRELDETNEQLALEVTERVAAEDALRERVKELAALQHFAQTLARRTDLPSALHAACQELAVLFRARYVRVHLSAGLGEDALRRSSSDAAAPPDYVDLLPVDDVPLFQEALKAEEPLVVADPQSLDLPAPLRELMAGSAVRSLLVAPMVTRDAVVGLLTLGRDGDVQGFSDADGVVGKTAADALAAAVENELLHRKETRQAAAGRAAAPGARPS